METHYTDLRPLLDPKLWRASDELQKLLRKPLARRSVKKGDGEKPRDWQHDATEKHEPRENLLESRHDNLVVLNDWIAMKTRRNFECGSGQQR